MFSIENLKIFQPKLHQHFLKKTPAKNFCFAICCHVDHRNINFKLTQKKYNVIQNSFLSSFFFKELQNSFIVVCQGNYIHLVPLYRKFQQKYQSDLLSLQYCCVILYIGRLFTHFFCESKITKQQRIVKCGLNMSTESNFMFKIRFC